MAAAFDIQALCGQFDRREIDLGSFVEQCARMIAAAVGCSRAGIWLFEEGPTGRVLRCLGIFDSVKGRMTLAPDESNEQVGAYFSALETSGHVLAIDARTHPATAGFFSEQLSRTGVHSLMASSFSLNGRLFGAFTCTQLQQPMHWTLAQLSILKRTGARVSLALAGASQTHQQTMPAPL